MIIMKFGGTSVQDAEAIRRVVDMVRGRLDQQPVMVVSALAKVTRQLLRLAGEAAAQHPDKVAEEMQAIREKHVRIAKELLEGVHLDQALSTIGSICDDLERFVNGICLIGELSPRSQARILSAGELLSSILLYSVMNQNGIRCLWADARQLIVTDDNYLSAKPMMQETMKKVLETLPEMSRHAELIVTQGFIAATSMGVTSVLGFEGSDYSASLLGMILGAEKVEIWTDVDGIRTADPRIVAHTRPIPQLSYEEAAEMAFLGARVLHPMTIYPARSLHIPINVRNTMNPEAEGTIVRGTEHISDGPKSIAFRTDIDFIEIGMGGFVSLNSLLAKVTHILERHRLEISLLSTCESGISLTLEAGQSGSEEAYRELHEALSMTLHQDRGQVSVMGKNVIASKKLTDDIHSVAGLTDVFTVGASGLSVSFVIRREQVPHVVERLHAILFGQK